MIKTYWLNRIFINFDYVLDFKLKGYPAFKTFNEMLALRYYLSLIIYITLLEPSLGILNK